jgi:AraC-like DNA-binding protein
MPFSDILRSYDSSRPELMPYGLECDKWKPVLMYKSDRHNEIEINYVVNGSFTYLIRDIKVRMEANTIAVFWALFPHQIVDFEGECSYYTLTIPFKRFMQFEWPSFFKQSLFSGQVFLYEDVFKDFEKNNFERWYADLQKKNHESEKVALLEIYAKIYRIAHTVSTNPELAYTGSCHGELSLAEKIAVYIASNYQNDIDVNNIAGEVGLNPDYANRVFKKYFGQPLKDFLTEQRIIHAQRMLLTTDKKIIEIAFDSGFNSLSRFNASFLKLTKTTPREYRHSFGLTFG